MLHGGKRPGAGKPKGKKWPSTIEKEAAREYLRQRVFAELKPMLDSQIENAKGFKYILVRERKGGKFKRVTQTMAEARKGLDVSKEEIIEVWEKDPNVHAFSDLLDRALDKAVQPVAAEHSGDLTVRWKGLEDD